jgi:uncharacterized protein (DUF2384 family)
MKVTKMQVIKKGKEVFGSTENFNLWLNKENTTMNCKPVSLWYTSTGLKKIYDELNK